MPVVLGVPTLQAEKHKDELFADRALTSAKQNRLPRMPPDAKVVADLGVAEVGAIDVCN